MVASFPTHHVHFQQVGECNNYFNAHCGSSTHRPRPLLTQTYQRPAQRTHRNISNYISPTSRMDGPLNVILFGETGVGKSSIVNLIAGHNVAKTSQNVNGCTMKATEYRLKARQMPINIWDTVGLEEPEMGVNGYLPAIEKAYALIQRLREVGGVNLLLFCIRGNRITTTTQSNYRLFYEVLCGKQVPVGIVITHLEREVNMEDWWVRNEKSIEKYGIKCAGHACVTGLPDNGKYAKSREAMCDLLHQHDGSGRYIMPEGDWLARLIMGLKAFLTGDKIGIPRGKNLERALVKRCGLDAGAAQRIMETMKENELATHN